MPSNPTLRFSNAHRAPDQSLGERTRKVFSSPWELLPGAGRLWIAALGFVLASCNGVFYYPSKAIYLTPAQQNISYDERMIPSTDGREIAVWRLKPDGKAKGTVVHFHGNAENMSTHFLFVSWLVAYGYEVYTFDYQGYGRSDGSPTRSGTVDDGIAVLRTVCDQAGETPVYVLAQSLGGAVAIPSLVLSERKDCVRAMVLESTFGSYRKMARDKLSSVWLTWPLQWPLSFLVTDDYSPVDYVHDLDLPLLIIHSRADPVVPWSQGQLILEAKLKQKPEVWVLDRPGHTVAFAPPPGPYRQKLVDWIAAQK